jgi:hypothetical protein
MAQRPAASVAVLADIHGNLPALSAVLAEAREYVLSHYSDTEALADLTEIARQQEGQAC